MSSVLDTSGASKYYLDKLRRRKRHRSHRALVSIVRGGVVVRGGRGELTGVVIQVADKLVARHVAKPMMIRGDSLSK